MENNTNNEINLNDDTNYELNQVDVKNIEETSAMSTKSANNIEELSAQSENEKLEANKLNTKITIDELPTYYVGNIITVHLKDSEGIGLSNSPIKVNDGYNESTYYTDDSGDLELTIFKPGTLNLKLIFEETNYYKGSNIEKTLNILTTVKMTSLTKIYNGYIEYTATFLDSNGNALKNEYVYFYIDDYQYGLYTNSNGIAKLSIKLKKGLHTIYGFNPITDDTSSKNIKVFDRITGNKNLNLFFGTGKIYKIRIYGDDGKPVKSGQKITIKLNSKKLTKTTDKNGYITLKLNNLKVGYYTITASYKGFEVTNKIHIKPVIIPSLHHKKIGKTFNVKVKLLDNNGKILKNKKITTKFNGKTYTAKTNSKGIATFKLKTPSKLGKYSFICKYGKAVTKETYEIYRK